MGEERIPWTFRLRSENTNHDFAAQSAKEMHAWMDSIVSDMKKYCGTGGQSSIARRRLHVRPPLRPPLHFRSGKVVEDADVISQSPDAAEEGKEIPKDAKTQVI